VYDLPRLAPAVKPGTGWNHARNPSYLSGWKPSGLRQVTFLSTQPCGSSLVVGVSAVSRRRSAIMPIMPALVLTC